MKEENYKKLRKFDEHNKWLSAQDCNKFAVLNGGNLTEESRGFWQYTCRINAIRYHDMAVKLMGEQ